MSEPVSNRGAGSVLGTLREQFVDDLLIHDDRAFLRTEVRKIRSKSAFFHEQFVIDVAALDQGHGGHRALRLLGPAAPNALPPPDLLPLSAAFALFRLSTPPPSVPT